MKWENANKAVAIVNYCESFPRKEYCFLDIFRRDSHHIIPFLMFGPRSNHPRQTPDPQGEAKAAASRRRAASCSAILSPHPGSHGICFDSCELKLCRHPRRE